MNNLEAIAALNNLRVCADCGLGHGCAECPLAVGGGDKLAALDMAIMALAGRDGT